VVYKTILKGLWSRVVVNASPLVETIKALCNFEKKKKKKKSIIKKMNGSIKENDVWGSMLNYEVHTI